MAGEVFDVCEDLNRSYTYVLPLTGVSASDCKNLRQCFVGDSTKPDIKDKVFVLIEKSEEEWYEYYKDGLLTNNLYYTHYTCDDYHEMFVYNLPDIFEGNYYKFLKGQYSKFDDAYKRHILTFHNLSTRSDVGKVLYRAEDKYLEWEKRLGTKISRNQEIGNMPDMSEEVYSEEMKVFKDKVNG